MNESFKVPEFLPKVQQIDEKSTEPEIPYKIPKWNGIIASENYSFEVLKNGVIVEEIKGLSNKPFHMIGRLPIGSVDITAAHPTVSRFHAVLQYKDASTAPESKEEVQHGWFIYDLDSTHGTFLNKIRVKPRTYQRIRVGYQLKLGNSTRNYILQGPIEDEEEESEFTITELKEQRAQRESELKQKLVEEQLEHERKKKEKEEAGVSWGMAADAEEEPDLSENPFATTTNEELFLDDPKKTLRGYFEREGYELEYRCDELSPGVFICRVELPIDDEYGKNIICEVQHKGKKKECVVQCALEACRILDRHGVLRQANHEPRRARKIENSDGSDDDIFFDRTGDVEKKRLKKLGPMQSTAFTYEQLIEQEKEILDKIQTKEHKLQLMVQLEKRQKMQNDEDLDDFMNNLLSMDHKVDKFAISTIKTEIQNLKVDHQKIQRLINIAKPSISLPPIAATKTNLPLFGKRNSLSRNFGVRKSETAVNTVLVATKSEAFKVEEDEGECQQSVEASKNAVMVPASVHSDDVTLNTEKPVNESFNVRRLEYGTSPDEPTEKKIKLDEPASAVSQIKPASTVSPQGKSSMVTPQEPASTMSPQEPTKKRKTRIRVRNRLRENIDMNDDDEYIDEEKVSTWVAPEDQTGDGTTRLNQKFGY